MKRAHKVAKLSFRFIPIALLVIGFATVAVSSAKTLFTSSPAIAAGEGFTWISKTKLQLVGGVFHLNNPTMPITAQINSNDVTAVQGILTKVKLDYGNGEYCFADIYFQLNSNLDPSKGMIIIKGSSGNSPVCQTEKTKINGYSTSGTQITINNAAGVKFDNIVRTGPETNGQKNITINVYPLNRWLDPRSFPREDVVQVTKIGIDGAADRTLGNVNITKQTDQAGNATNKCDSYTCPETTYRTTVGPYDPGTYKFCSLTAKTCYTYEKVKYKPLTANIGTQGGFLVTSVDAKTKDTEGTVAHRTFYLKYADGLNQTLLDLEGTPDGAPVNGVQKYKTSFASIGAGKYLLCFGQGDTSTCNTVQKGAGDLNMVLVQGDSTEKSDNPKCQIQGALGWILNPICDIAVSSTEKLGEHILVALQVEPLSQSSDTGTYETWKIFRDLANALLVLVFLIAIFAQVLPFEVDPYMVKKVMPKLIAAAIGIQISFFICQFMVDIANVLGLGVGGLMQTAIDRLPDAAQSASQTNIASMAFIGITGVAITVFFIGPVLLLLLSAIISILTMLITIQARQIILIFLAIASPLAILAWVMPNTEDYAKKWAQMYIKLLLMFPLIAFILSGATLVYGVMSAATTTPSGGTELSSIQQVMINFIPVIAFFMIPATFKASGMITGAIASAGFAKSRGLSSRASAGAKAQTKGLKDNFQRSMAIKATDKNNNAGLRFGARALSGAGLLGTLNKGKRAQYQNAKRGEEGLNEEMKLITNQLTEEGLNGDNAALKNWLFEKPRSKAEQIAAMRMLGENGGIEELADIYDRMEGKAENLDKDGKRQFNGNWSNAADRDIWQQGTTNSRSALAKALPYSVRPDHDTSVGKIDAEGYASLKGVAGQKQHISNGLKKIRENYDKAVAAGNTEDAMKYQQQLQKSFASMVGVGQSTDRRGRVDANTVLDWQKAVDDKVFDGVVGDLQIGKKTYTAKTFADTFIEKSTGQLKSVTEQSVV